MIHRLVPVLALLVATLPAACAVSDPYVKTAAAPSESALVADALPEWRSAPSLAKLDATAWMQTAVEYDAACLQAWTAARRSLDEALSRPHDSARPPAIVVDCDETVLDNGPYEAWLVQRGGDFSLESWGQWCAEGRAPEIPGAPEFLSYAAERGVTVFYVTNRQPAYEGVDGDVRRATAENLAWIGCPLDDPDRQLLMRGDVGKGSDKQARREHVLATHRVLLYAGDDLGDFLSHDKVGPAERERLLEQHRERFGRDWIVLPNPVYGSWERALFRFHDSLPAEEKLRHRRDGLLPWK